jgi:hypothetical protein
MSFKDALIVLTTYPELTPVSAVDDAIDLAAALGARVSAIACEVKIRAPGSPLGNYLLDIPAMVNQKKCSQFTATSGDLPRCSREKRDLSGPNIGAMPDLRST